MIEGTEYADACPRCRALMVTQECFAIGCEDGWIDMYEFGGDPMWYDPGDIERCDECNGRGHLTWCPDCGYDVNEQGIAKNVDNGRH